MIKKIGKTKIIVLLMILALLISVFSAIFVYADNDSYTVTINYDDEKFEVRQRTNGEGDPIPGEIEISERINNWSNATINLVDAENQYFVINNVVIDEENHQIKFTVTKGETEDNPRATKIFVSNNRYHLFNMQNEEVNLDFYSDNINTNTEYQIGTYSELGFIFQYNQDNPQDVDGIESINDSKDTITYKKWANWDGEQDKSLYYDINVSLVKGTVDNNVITVSEVCQLEQTWYMQDEEKIYNQGNYRFNINRMNFDGYYLKIDTSVYNDIALRYNLNNLQENFNISDVVIRDAEAESNNNYYVPLNVLAKGENFANLNIGGFENRYDNHKITFQNVTAISDNKLTYKYNGKNVYVEFIDNNWEFNNETDRWEEIERVNPLTLVENTDNSYECNVYTNNGFGNYKLKLSFDNEDRELLEGSVTLRINGTRASFDDIEDENNPGKWINIPDRIALYNYNEDIVVNGPASFIGDTSVEFKNASYQGVVTEPTKGPQEWDSVEYHLPNDRNVRVNIETKGDRDEWYSINFNGINGLKMFSDEIQDGKYRISIEGTTADLVINNVNKKDSMEEAYFTYRWTDKENPTEEDWEERQGSRDVYILKPADIQNGKIELGIEFSYKIRVEKNVTLSNNNRTVEFSAGSDDTKIKATFNTTGQFVERQEVFDDNSTREYYELEIPEEEITDKLISVDNNFNSETMEIVIRDWSDFKLSTYEENGVRYVKITGLTDTYQDEHGENIEERYYLPTEFDFYIRLQGSGEYHELPSPAAKVGYFTISEGEDPDAGGTVHYYFLKKVNDTYVYIDNNGAVLDGIQEAGSVSEFPEGSAEIAYPEGAEYIEIKVSGKNQFSEPTNIDLFFNGERIRNLQVLDDNSNPIENEVCDLQDIVKAKNGRIPFKLTELGENTIGMTIYFAYIPVGNLDIQEPGIYLNPTFSEDDMSASLMYKTNKDNTERTIDYYTRPEDKVVVLPQDITTFTLKANYSNLVEGAPEIHIDILNSNMEPISDIEQMEIGNRLVYDGMRDDGETPNNYWDDFMDEFRQGHEATFDITPLGIVENNYTLVLNINFKGLRDPDNDRKAHVLSWSNDPNEPWGRDALIDGGKAYLKEAYKEQDGEYVKIYDRTTNGDVFHCNEMEEFKDTWPRNNGKMYEFAVNQNNGGGEVEAVEGIKLVFEFIPNYGKQLVEVGLGRRDAEIGADQRSYEFIMPAGHVHFSARFKEVENTTSGDYIEASEYTLPQNIEDIVGSGTLDLSLKDVSNQLTDEQKQAFANINGENFDVSKYLDVDLNQIWYKGKDDSEDVWSEPIYDLGNGNEVTVTVKVPDGINVRDVVILHEEHNGDAVIGYTKIDPISYNEETRTITFKTSKFSNFAIATGETHNHSPAQPVRENVVPATCTAEGSYDEVIYCEYCHEEISRTSNKVIEKVPHTPGEAVRENVIDSTCSQEGSYDEVFYCTVCHAEISRTSKTIEKLAHTPEINESATVKKATLTENGYVNSSTEIKCSICDEEIGGYGDSKTIFHPETFILSKTIFSYNKKTQKPTIIVKDSEGYTIDSANYTVSYSNSNSKKIGEYSVTVTFKGDYYEGSKTLKYQIAPKGTSLSKVKAGKKSFTASWKKQTTETTGYQVQYSTTKDFSSGVKNINISKNKTTSTTKKKLKAKAKYYVRIRTYKKVGSKKIYSDWSSAKKVTTKK